MKIIAIGEQQRFQELQEKIKTAIVHQTSPQSTDFGKFDLIIDLNFDDNPANIQYYAPLDKPIILSAVKIQLAEIAARQEKINGTLIGMNLLPTFINKEKVEVSLLHSADKEKVKTLLQKLNWNPLFVQDRAGMVTPRVIFMIINEACYTLQEGTAEIKDIDLGMKLGTNYPYGPFEWADKIGISNVYETLKAVYEDTKEERYKICPLLKTYCLSKEKFYIEE